MSEIVGYLIGQVGEMSGMRVAIPTKGLVIGRDPKESELVISHTLVSRKHAQVAVGKDGKLYLIDLQSRNGTFVNGHKLSAPAPLQPNDKIEFGAEGKVVFLFESADTTSVSGVLKEAFGETVATVEWKVGDTILGIYEVTGLLGQGGFGKVYKVHHKSWNMDLAVKSPLPKLFDDEKAVENFIREAETWVNLDLHPNIVQCHYVRTIGGIPRIFAEYVSGGTLHQWIAQKKLTTLEQILDVAIQFAWGLHAAHEQGIVHQDVKPLNVLMTPDGIAKVSDFGLARSKPVVTENITTGDGNLVTMAGNFTLPYCSPEQVEAAKQRAEGVPSEERVKLSRSTDVWSWAVSVLHMFTGQITWQYGFQAGQVLKEHRGLFGRKLPIRMPKQLAQLLEHCLQFRPADRPKNMLEIATALLAIYETQGGQPYARPEPKLTEHLADSLNNRALSLLDLGRTEQAEQTWQEALKVDPQHLESIYNSGLHEWRNARTDDWALVWRLRKAGVNSPTWYSTLMVAQVKLESGDAEETVGLLTDLGKSSNQHPGIDTLLALAQSSLAWSCRCLRTFEGHTKRVSSVCLSTDGRYALSGSYDKTVRLWEVGSGRCLRIFEGHTDWVMSVCLSSDGRYALSGSSGGLRLWEVTSGRCLRVFQGKGILICSVSLSDDGRYALSGSTDHKVRLWEVASGRCVRVFEGHSDAVLSVSLSADGRYALSGSFDGLRLWEVASGRCLKTFEGYNLSACLSGDGRYALSASKDHALQLWETASGRCLRVLRGHTNSVWSVSLSTDGLHALSGSNDHTLRLWELTSGRCLKTFEGHTDGINSGCFSRDGRYALSGGEDKTLRLWEIVHQPSYVAPWMLCQVVATAKLNTITVQFEGFLEQAKQALSEDRMQETVNAIRQARALCGHQRTKTVVDIWQSLYSRLPKREFICGWVEQTLCGHTHGILSVCLSADGRYALSGSEDKTLRLWEVASGQCVRVLEGFMRFSAFRESGALVCLSSDGRYVFTTDRSKLQFWDTRSGQCVRTFDGHTGIITSVCLSADNRYALSGSYDKTLRLWEVASGRCLKTFEEHANVITSVYLSDDVRYALSGSWDEKLRLWEVTSGRCLRIFQGHTRHICSVCLSNDGQYALSGSEDKTLRLWEVATGRCLQVLRGHTDIVTSVCFSSDGRYVVSGSMDDTIRLWEVVSGRCLQTLFEHYTHGIRSVCLSIDGRYALAGSGDGILRLWTLDWELDVKPMADWDDSAAPHLRNFLVLHCPVADDGLTRIGKPKFNEDDFKHLLYTLGCAGYGWLRPEGVRRELEKMAATWTEPPPFGVG